MPTKDPLRVLLVSSVGIQINPYLRLLEDGLRAAGGDVRRVPLLTPADLCPPAMPDIVHFHWLDRYAPVPVVLLRRFHGKRDLARRLVRRVVESVANAMVIRELRRRRQLSRLFAQLERYRAQGGRLVYTIHNLEPHEEVGRVDAWGMGRMMALADGIHVHDRSTADALAKMTGRTTGVRVIPHGHYIGSYPCTVDREEARRILGLPSESFVYLNLGLMRPYKGLEELLLAFAANPDPALRLMIAGKPADPAYAERLRRLALDDPRVQLHPRFIAPEEVQFFMNAADACVLPYRQITTSGAAILAFSFGLPVIAPVIGAFPHLVAPGRGILYRPEDPDGLPAALTRAKTTSWGDRRSEIRDWVAQFDWTTIGAEMVDLYSSLP